MACKLGDMNGTCVSLPAGKDQRLFHLKIITPRSFVLSVLGPPHTVISIGTLPTQAVANYGYHLQSVKGVIAQEATPSRDQLEDMPSHQRTRIKAGLWQVAGIRWFNTEPPKAPEQHQPSRVGAQLLVHNEHIALCTRLFLYNCDSGQ